MRISLLIAIVLICGIANAQVLKLKAGQKFSYEGINDREQKGQYTSKNYDYWKTNFEVISHVNGVYTFKASPEVFLAKWHKNVKIACSL
ncbi:hypothetical protein [Pedobacter sp. JCM 36344]|uniref:hypothetical protein n=1 Tax=Pedobacter sp. JCM 36344 TaxID=3374280 RepID=UPI00397A77AB